MSAIFFSTGDSHTKGLLVLLHLGLEGVTEIDTDRKGRFVSFKVTHSNERVLCVYVPSEHSTREKANKIILGDFNCTMYKTKRDGSNKTLYRCRFNNALSNLTVDNGLADLWRKKNKDSSDMILLLSRYDRSSGRKFRIDTVYTYIKFASNAKFNRMMDSFTNHFD